MKEIIELKDGRYSRSKPVARGSKDMILDGGRVMKYNDDNIAKLTRLNTPTGTVSAVTDKAISEIGETASNAMDAVDAKIKKMEYDHIMNGIKSRVESIKGILEDFKVSGNYTIEGDFYVFDNIAVDMKPSLYLVAASYTSVIDIYRREECIGIKEQPVINSMVLFDSKPKSVNEMTDIFRKSIGSHKDFLIISISQLV